jgi:uncharacterized protein (TIGR02145 family)
MFANGCKKDNTTPTTKDLTKVIDADGNVYKTVVIGTQEWMAENLKTTKYNNGDPIATTTLDISAEIGPKYQWAYGDDATNVDIYGRLYTWFAIADSRNVCPTGWHVPSDAEFETLKTFLGTQSTSGVELKEAGTIHWSAPNTGANNLTGFTALPAGYRTMTGGYVSLHLSCYLWSASDNAPLGWGQSMHYNDSLLLRGGYNKQAGVSIRCLRDNL